MRIVIFGGSGFVGTELSRELVKQYGDQNLEILIPSRSSRDNSSHPAIKTIIVDINDAAQMTELVKGADVVINLVGILNEKGFDGSGFHKAHVQLAENMIQACQKHGVKRVLQMSALNADANDGPSYYLRSKGQAEDLLKASGLDVSFYQPSVIFGPNDSFFNRFADLLKVVPVAFPIACPDARFAPVYVNDVVTLMAKTLVDANSYGMAYELGGPKEYTLKELVIYTRDCLGKKTWIIPLNDCLSHLQARVFDFVPGKPFSTDNYQSTRQDSVCTSNALPDFAIIPTPIEDIVPSYLGKTT